MKPRIRLQIALLYVLLLSIYTARVKAQLTLGDIAVEAGTTYAEWDGLFSPKPGKYTPKWGYFVGGSMKIKTTSNSVRYLKTSFYYQNTQTFRPGNNERIKLDELTLSLGPGISWRKLDFGFDLTAGFILAKKKIDNSQLTGIDLDNVEDFYGSVNGNIYYRLNANLSIFTKQIFFSTKIYHTYKIERGERFESPYYPRITLIGAGYNF